MLEQSGRQPLSNQVIKVDIHSKGTNQNHVYADIHWEEPASEDHMKLIRQTQVKGHSTIKHCSEDHQRQSKTEELLPI